VLEIEPLRFGVGLADEDDLREARPIRIAVLAVAVDRLPETLDRARATGKSISYERSRPARVKSA